MRRGRQTQKLIDRIAGLEEEIAYEQRAREKAEKALEQMAWAAAEQARPREYVMIGGYLFEDSDGALRGTDGFVQRGPSDAC